ncbi:MAG: hypothetical protein QXP97_03740 [Desulfurococcus sp.]|uniref:hypothetical protein n=1 Tax=Desulfurococcus sp. TaxID=51678 RepID=UPI0031663C69
MGHNEATRIIREIFSRGLDSWPIGRSIFHALKRFDSASEGSYHTAEVELRGWEIYFYLKDYYGNVLKSYSVEWSGDPLLPCQRRGRGLYTL